jgi:hypothetical protein
MAAPPPVPKRTAFGCRKVTSDVQPLGYAPAPSLLETRHTIVPNIQTWN